MNLKLIALLFAALFASNCSYLGMSSEEEEDQSLNYSILLGAAYLSSQNPCNSTASNASTGTVGANSTTLM